MSDEKIAGIRTRREQELKLFQDSIKQLKISILKDISLMHIVYETNTLFDKFFRYLHLGLACIVFLILTIANTLDAGRISGSFSIILSGIVTFLIKLRDFIKYGDVKETAKKQTAKYAELLDRIDIHIGSVDTADTSNVEHFANAIRYEYRTIKVDDPEISYTTRKKYEEFCKKVGIPSDDVADRILALMDKSVSPIAVSIAQEEPKPEPAPKEESISEFTPLGTMTKQRLQTYMQRSQNIQSAWIKDRLNNLGS
jgi:hypothetical protein